MEFFFIFIGGVLAIGIVFTILGNIYGISKVIYEDSFKKKKHKTFEEAIEKTAVDTYSKSRYLLSKTIQGTYKHFFNEIENFQIESKHPDKTYSDYITIISHIQNGGTDRNIISEYQKYQEFIGKVDFNKLAEILFKYLDANDMVEIFLFLECIGVENTLPFSNLIMDIEKAYWKNDIELEEKNKLMLYFLNKVVE